MRRIPLFVPTRVDRTRSPFRARKIFRTLSALLAALCSVGSPDFADVSTLVSPVGAFAQTADAENAETAENVKIAESISDSDPKTDAFGSYPDEPIALSPGSSGGAGTGSGGSSGEIGDVADDVDPFHSDSPSSWLKSPTRASRYCVFQSVQFNLTREPNAGDDRLGFTDVSTKVNLGFPLPTVKTPLVVTPLFGWTALETPRDLPKPFGDKLDLFSQGAEIQYYRPLNERWLIAADFNAYYNADYRAKGSDSWFFSGFLAAAYKRNPTTNVLFGVYCNPQARVWKALPFGGVLWRPNDDFYVEGYLPYPKVAKRVDFGAPDPSTGKSPYWVYLAGSIDGNDWAFRTQDASASTAPEDVVWSGRSARASYFDLRLFVGLEAKTYESVDWALEAGLAFARESIFETTDGGTEYYRKYKPDAVGLFRFRASY